ncbi:hypothetical protein QQS21_002629 [Conoideocrella luteorostrata]|uniref:Uncharacterized protein n=1 Tax=Conoideocrella luteorostrata TaxID=1105319 RepID=A0AAJ0CYS7_9HYPO|nr:hypothetical protein QQS21_002629 [Conoideocrella luteorostrata]
MQTQSAKPIEFEFVTGNRPDQLKADSSRKLRSFLSKRSWQAHRVQHQLRGDISSPSTSSSSESQTETASSCSDPQDGDKPRQNKAAVVKNARRRRNKLQAVTFECVAAVPAVALPEDEVWQVIRHSDGADSRPRSYLTQDRMLQLFEQTLSRALPMDAHFGGIRMDPFRSYPGTWQPHIPALADHYIVQMARDIPELDQPGNKGLLRSLWFPLVISDDAPFRVVMLLSAANYASVNNVNGLGCHILRMKQEAIAAINNVFRRDGRKCTNDSIVGAVAKMASFEAMHGDVESYKMHMDGLVRMLATRGGLDRLGLGGLLRRTIVWIDLNSSFLLNVPRYFPGTTFTGVEEREVVEIMEPNPERFIAV